MTDWAKYEFKEYIKAEQIMFNLPLGVSISTMCGKCKLGTQLNIDFINTHLLLSSNDILTVKINNENMRTLIEKKAKKDLIIPEQDSFRWALEEYRVSLFAQQLKTAYPISVKRMDKLWDSRS